jgi:DNA adenine methylase
MTHRENILKKYNLDDKGYSLEELAEITSKPLDTLQEVYNRGIGAYKTNPKSVRMKGSYKKNVNAPMSKKLSKEQWAMARVYSFLDGNPEHDNDLQLEGGLKPISARIGGKVLLKKKLVDKYFPPSSDYKTYVEPFVGGGSIYFYKNKDGHKEVVNDLDPSIYQLFKGFQKYASVKLADDVNGDYTEEDFNSIKESQPKDDYDKFLKTYLLYKLSYFGKGERFGKPRISTKFTEYKERLENVDILNKDYKEVIEKYDSPSTFFYLDPPVRAQSGKFNFPAIDVKELAEICKSIKGKFLLSLADKPNKELFKGFTIKEIPTKYVQGRSKGGQSLETNEYLIMNYKPSGLSGGVYEPDPPCDGLGDPKRFFTSIKGVDYKKYLKIAKKKAKANGYDPDKLHFSCNGKHKLYYDRNDNKEDCVHFGDKDYNDHIIYSLQKNTNADKYRDAYRARATRIPGDWEKDKYSPNNMAIKILW